MKTSHSIIILALGILVLSSCSQSNSPITVNKSATYYGESQPFANDSIRSWYKTDANGALTSIGVSFNQDAFSKLEMDTDVMLMMKLPNGINSPSGWNFDHVEVDWVPKGDPKPSVYDIAHLDVHFFGVSESEQMDIEGGADLLTTNMPKSYLPSDYMLDAESEAGMGVHAYDTTGKEYHGQPFDHSFVYGYYHGNLYFMEPMVAKTYLDSKTNFSADIKQPQSFRFPGAYPTKYNIRYDGSAKQYTISIDNFIVH
ncbi:MAG: hypothetical protein Q8916_05220 [Bacteroidota bacterium]|nr:hypothetical protein [Bacteroidota bacterium]MDP4229789.1 hypothetical protein [Bacteroidota bacterium]MDP4236672.1 hypothetical protein [Bacteroidota bacterium]